MQKRFLCISGILLLALLFIMPRVCLASIMLFDDKLRVKGSVYEFIIYGTNFKKDRRQYRDTRLGLLRTKGTLELLYKLTENEKLLVNLFGFFQYFHEATPDVDDEYRRSISARERKRFQGPYFDQDDWINELYADIYYGPWNIRLGKQIIFWSEVELVRTIDRINPLDLRYSTPGIDPWDEIKLGLWMLRGFYNSNLPGQLVFEGIWIPGDFEQVRTPKEGTYWGRPAGPPGPRIPRPFGQQAVIDEMWRHSKPAVTLKNSSWALRVRGNSEVWFGKTPYLLDWTVSWYHGMNQTPVPKQEKLGRASPRNYDINTLNGYMNTVAERRNNDLPIPHVPHNSWWKFKFFDVIGTSCQTFVPALKGVLRGEFTYEIGLPEIKTYPENVDGLDGDQAFSKLMTGTTERDQVNIGITLDRPVRWKWLQQRWGANGILDCSLGWFAQWRIGNVSRIRRTFAYNDRSQNAFTLLIRTRLRHNELWPVIKALYNTRNFGYVVTACRYVPGAHWRFEMGYMWFYAKSPWQFRDAAAEDNDNLYFRFGYEF